MMRCTKFNLLSSFSSDCYYYYQSCQDAKPYDNYQYLSRAEQMIVLREDSILKQHKLNLLSSSSSCYYDYR